MSVGDATDEALPVTPWANTEQGDLAEAEKDAYTASTNSWKRGHWL